MICTSCFGVSGGCPVCFGTGVLPNSDVDQSSPKDHRLFATDAFPIHASAIPELMRCPWKLAMIYLFDPEDVTSEAADTGSATHIAVSHWHRSKELAAAVRAMREASEARFTKANLDEAAAMFLLYARDPRNQEAQIAQDKDGRLLLEYPVQFKLEPSSDDPTHETITIVGTLDQVRISSDNRLLLWDLKTSKKPGWDQLNTYLYQQAAYAVAASFVLKQQVRLGGLITPRHYKVDILPEGSPSGIFWHYTQKFDDLEMLINGLRGVVANIRRGDIHISPGEHCRWCPAKGVESCVPLLRSIVHPQTKRLHFVRSQANG